MNPKDRVYEGTFWAHVGSVFKNRKKVEEYLEKERIKLGSVCFVRAQLGTTNRFGRPYLLLHTADVEGKTKYALGNLEGTVCVLECIHCVEQEARP